MRRLASAAIALVLSFVGSVAARADWVAENVETDGFSAVFPVSPKAASSVDGGVKIRSYAGSAPGAICLVLVADYPYRIDPEVELTASRDSFAKGVEAVVTRSARRNFPRGAAPLAALEFDAVGATYIYRSILVIEGSRAYQVAGGVPKDGNVGNLERCVRGFKLTPR